MICNDVLFIGSLLLKLIFSLFIQFVDGLNKICMDFFTDRFIVLFEQRFMFVPFCDSTRVA